MVEATSNLMIRYMRPIDIPEVVAIDRASFSPPWPPSSYRFEINESKISFMAILEKAEPQPIQGIRRIWSSIVGDDSVTVDQKVVVGYGGLWNIGDEAHISTIASHPDHRGNKYGEILIASMIRRAISLEAGYVVLEVRVGNVIAQNLYKKYGFEIVGTKPEYYQQDREDAYDMRLNLTREAIENFNHLYAVLRDRIPFEDHYSHTNHPRLGR